MNAERTIQLEIYTDGNCPLCRWMRARVEPLDRERRLVWLDYNEPEISQRAAPRTLKELSAEMYVRRRSDDGWFRGFGAWREVLKTLPQWRWLGKLFGWFPFTVIGEPLYRFIANHRYTLFGVPPPCDAEGGVCKVHNKESELRTQNSE